MTNKDEASPRQRILMEQRWEKVRADCAYERCQPEYRFHAAGCPRRAQRTKLTDLNTGEVHDVTIVHSDVTPVREATSLTQAQLDEIFAAQAKAQKSSAFPEQEDTWSRWERGVFEERFPEAERFVSLADRTATTPETETAPARPWWKRVFRRG
jgi:hypothetical protein